MTKGWYRWISILLVCVLGLMPGVSCAQEVSGQVMFGTQNVPGREVLDAQQEAMCERISALIDEKETFEFQGEAYPLGRDGLAYANENLQGTADYDLYCTALMEAEIAWSNRIGEAFLEEIKRLNETAVSLGYEHYLDYEWQVYGLDGDPADALRMFMAQYPKTFRFMLTYDWLYQEGEESPLEDQALLQMAAQAYAEISPDYGTAIRDLVKSDAFVLLKSKAGMFNGLTTAYDASIVPPVTVSVSGSGTSSFLPLSVHEFGHYLHEIAAQGSDMRQCYEVSETHSIGGMLLCEAAVEDAYTRALGEAYGAYCTLQYNFIALTNLVLQTINYLTVEDMYLHPEDHQPEDFAKTCLDLYLSTGVDCGYSEAYQMLLGVQWYTHFEIFSIPTYSAAYALGTNNAVWLWHQQAQGGDGAQMYIDLVSAVMPDTSARAFLEDMGLPDPLDPQMYAGLDDFVYDKLASLYVKAFGEEPY